MRHTNAALCLLLSTGGGASSTSTPDHVDVIPIKKEVEPGSVAENVNGEEGRILEKNSPVADADNGILNYPSEADQAIASKQTREDDGNSESFVIDTTDDENQDVFTATKIRTLQAQFVNCVYGELATPQTCAEECATRNLNCCDGDRACNRFTGKLFNNSCNGYRACDNANIPTVMNSCNDYGACFFLGRFGVVGEIVDSCNGDNACNFLGRNGVVGEIVDSCNSNQACALLGYNGVVGEIVDSCNSYKACAVLGLRGVVGEVVDSCNDVRACYFLGYNGNQAGNLTEACNGDNACFYIQNHSEIKKSCNNDYACYKQGVVTSEMESCCNGANDCAYANTPNNASLPIACTATKKPTAHPTSQSSKSGKSQRSKTGKTTKGSKSDLEEAALDGAFSRMSISEIDLESFSF